MPVSTGFVPIGAYFALVSTDPRYHGRTPIYPQHFEWASYFAPTGPPGVNFAPMHQYIDNNVQYVEGIDNLAGEVRSNTDVMIEEFEQLKAGYYGLNISNKDHKQHAHGHQEAQDKQPTKA